MFSIIILYQSRIF